VLDSHSPIHTAGARTYCDKLTYSQETLSEEILTKMHAGGSLKPKYPVLTPNDLKEVDGLIIGAPTRFVRGSSSQSTERG